MPEPADIPFDLRGLIDNSLLEWEGKLAAVAIAGGCNLRCPYCHSWRYVTGLADLQPIPLARLFALLERQRDWLDGVVVTGGEPTLQLGVADLLRWIRDTGLPVKLHSNGTRPDRVRELLDEGLLHTLALDFKSPPGTRFAAVSGVSNAAALTDAVAETFALAQKSGVEREYHTTLSPRFVTPETLEEMAGLLAGDGTWILQQYENDDCLDPRAAGRERYDGAALDRLEAAARALHPRVLMKRGKSSSL